MIRELSKIFDVVRLLDEETLETGNIKDVTDAEGFPCKCYSFWKKGDNCKNCTSRDAFRKKNEQLKLEYLDSNIYQVISKYVEIDGKPYVMELINQMNADAVMDEDGRNELIKQLSEQEDIRAAGDVVRKVSPNDLDNKNVLGNEGRLQIKRLYAAFANKKLRNKYFGF